MSVFSKYRKINNGLYFIVVVYLCLINGCATKGENLIINSYSDMEKSVWLSDKGIQLYNNLLENDDLALIPKIKEFLQESLKLNPRNEKAVSYLQKIEKYSGDLSAKLSKLTKNKIEAAAAIDGWISEIDGLIGRKEIALAYQKIKSLKPLIRAKDKMQELNNRKTQVLALVDGVYNAAVADFVAGNYSLAVKGFRTTLAVSHNYKEAENYLKKSKSELKVLDLY